ncbi:hypothetical protein, partial [Nonomuraea sp. NPDC003201]
MSRRKITPAACLALAATLCAGALLPVPAAHAALVPPLPSVSPTPQSLAGAGAAAGVTGPGLVVAAGQTDPPPPDPLVR